MDQSVLFEEKVFLSPKDMNLVKKTPLDTILMRHLKEKLEKKCSKHGYVIPGSLQFLSKSMGHLENGRFTGNIVFHVQAEGRVYNPVNGTRITCKVLKKNKMGLYGIYEDAIRILVPRDLHLGNEVFDSIQVNQDITVEIRKSRFQLNDLFILSVGILLEAGALTEKEEVIEPAVKEVTVAPEVLTTKEEDGVEVDELIDIPPTITETSKNNKNKNINSI